jgi:hypothetical protein
MITVIYDERCKVRVCAIDHGLTRPYGSVELVGGLRHRVLRAAGHELGRAAEIAFEDICRTEIDPTEFSISDLRQGRSNTDYRLLNGASRPLYRFNVKFFGSVFRRGAEMVNLAPTDCFPLAAYKIHAALQEQDRE